MAYKNIKIKIKKDLCQKIKKIQKEQLRLKNGQRQKRSRGLAGIKQKEKYKQHTLVEKQTVGEF